MAKPTLLLYPGAGSDRDQPSLVAIDQALGSGASVERLDFPYRKQGAARSGSGAEADAGDP